VPDIVVGEIQRAKFVEGGTTSESIDVAFGVVEGEMLHRSEAENFVPVFAELNGRAGNLSEKAAFKARERGTSPSGEFAIFVKFALEGGKKCAFDGFEGKALGIVGIEVGKATLGANKLSALRLVVILEPIGKDEARGVIVGVVADILEERVFMGHGVVLLRG
jgi:hypothetical protein